MSAPALLCVATLVAQAPFHLEPAVGGLTAPVAVAQPAGESSKLFVAEQSGRIRIAAGGLLASTPFLDVSPAVFVSAQTGLLGFAFHPDYASNGWVYLYYSLSTSNTVLARYTVPVPWSYAVDPTSEKRLLTITDSEPFHHGGGLAFGPDAKLYLGIGDRRIEKPGSTCMAQDGHFLLGKVLRLEDDGSIPADNPFVGEPALRDEIWLIGVRNPYRMSFDPGTGELFIADVGDGMREEIDRLMLGQGAANLGWRIQEGMVCASTISCPLALCGTPHMVDPVHDYDHSVGCCVIGGAVYRGVALPHMTGKYLFTDWCGTFVRALGFGPGGTQVEELTAALDPGPGLMLDSPTSIDVDARGEFLLVDAGWGTPGQGEVYRVLPPQPLSADRYAISVAAGGTQHLALDAGPSRGLSIYLVLGSLSGTTPGVAIGPHLLPLAFDEYLLFTLGNPNKFPLATTLGVLDSAGKGQASVHLHAGGGPELAGLVLHHAFVALDFAAPAPVELASNAVPLWITP